MKTTQLGSNLLDVCNTLPHVGCTDVDPSMDRCSCHSFGLPKCGCSCVRAQRGEHHSTYVKES